MGVSQRPLPVWEVIPSFGVVRFLHSPIDFAASLIYVAESFDAKRCEAIILPGVASSYNHTANL
jgi:hypothetical protein